ncbi:MAG: hypothetical protein HFH30_13290 [Eubacterium sp.]|nr:hypothetical protein [Eubacterium sp.]MCI8917626.1 hypothetical protein [Eubacterium sp.]
MRVNNVSIFAGGDAAAGRISQNGRAAGQKQQKAGSINAAFLNGQFDPIEKKREMAKKRADKIISDTYAGERRLDDEVKLRGDRLKQHYKTLADSSREIAKIDEEKEALRKEYGVEKDSKEQKDLEILEKYKRSNRHVVEVPISKEEREYAQKLEAEGLTEYQERALQMDSFKDRHLKNIQDSKGGIIEEAATIRAMGLERLKKFPMLEAQQEAEKVLESASDEIIGMLIDEAKDHIDDKAEEEQEKAEEKKEEEKEEQEKLEEAKEHREEMEALTDPEKAEKVERERRRPQETEVLYADPMTAGMLKMENVKNDIQQEVSDMMLKMKLVAEDLKGLSVDEVL